MRRISLFLLLVIAASANAATVSLGNLAGNAGQSVTVSIPLQNQGAQLAGVQFDLIFDKTAMTITAVAGDAANAAQKFISTSSQPGGIRIIVAGFNQNLIADGNVANLTIAIGAQRPPRITH